MIDFNINFVKALGFRSFHQKDSQQKIVVEKVYVKIEIQKTIFLETNF